MKRLIFVAMAMVAALAVTSKTADAAALYQLTLSSGGSTVVVNDGLAGDFCGAPKCVVSFGAILAGWGNVLPLNVTGTAPGDNPLSDMNAVVNGSGTGFNALTITWSGTDYSGPVPGFMSLIGGTVQGGGTLTYQAWINTSNALNGMTTPIGGPMVFSSGAFSGTNSIDMFVGGTYSLTQQVIISSGTGGSTSFNAAIDPVPEPGSMVLLGTGLLGLAAMARRRMRKTA